MAFLATESEDVYNWQKIENYKSCQIWLEAYNSPSTKKAYKIHLSLFCRYHNIDPDSSILIIVPRAVL